MAEFDDGLLEKFLEGEEIRPDEIRASLRQATTALKAVPVVCGSAYKYKGVQRLLDNVIYYLPAPADVEAVKGVLPNSDEEVVRSAREDAPFSGLAFKVMTDPFVGSLTFVRVYSGIMESGKQLLNSVKGEKQRVGRMLLMHANSREDIKEVRAGEIVAIAGLKNTTTGETKRMNSCPPARAQKMPP